MARSSKHAAIALALALAALIASAIALMHFKAAHDDVAALVEGPPAASAKSERANSALELPLPNAEVTTAAPAEAQHAPAARPSDDVTVLHVQVVDKSGAAITSGMLDCNWRASVEKPASGRVNARISGATTDVTLPKEASLCKVTASAAGFPPVQVTAAGFRGTNRKSGPITGRVDHDVRIVLGNTNTGTTLSGAIFVNGERRVPDGLNVIVDNSIGRALVNQVDASYVVAVGLENVPGMLRVDSDDTPTRQFKVPDADADGNRHVDLVLESKRVLRVHAVDDASGAPAAGVSLSCYARTKVESSFSRVTFAEHTVRKTTDAQGNCELRTLPDDGLVTLREAKDETAQYTESDTKPLLTLTITDESPAQFDETVRVNAARATVWGTVPAPAGSGLGMSSSYRVTRARQLDSGRPSYDEKTAPQDAQGHWSFECDAPSEWLVWLNEGDTRVSQVEHVSVDRARSIGPVQLALAPMRDVKLRMIHLPPQGRITLFANDVAGGPTQRENFSFSTQELAHVLHLQGLVRVNIHCQSTEPGSKTETSRVLTIDPQATPEVVVDMHGDRMRAAEFVLNGASPKGESVLAMLALGESGERTGWYSIFTLSDGKSDSSVAVPSGKYLYFLTSDADRGLVCGIVNVPESSDPSVLRIEWSGKSLARESLGAGVELVSIDGFSCANLKPNERQIRWSSAWGANVTTLLMPDKCEYTVLK